MKKLVIILILIFAISLPTQAQNKKGVKVQKMSTMQRATLQVKKMTLDLDLNTKQQEQIMRLVTEKIETGKKVTKARKEITKSNKRANSDALFAMKSKRLDAQIKMKNKLKQILTAEQFQEFEKSLKRKKRMTRKRMKHQKGKRGKKRGSRD